MFFALKEHDEYQHRAKYRRPNAPEAEYHSNCGQDVDEDDPYEQLPRVQPKGRFDRMQEHKGELSKESRQVDEEHLCEASAHEIMFCRQNRGAEATHQNEHDDPS